ncbi:MAG: endonuclease domain-containing protein [Pseudomonadota bacterium]|nr:endonuclease domain-containing protein [Pseudomonadota bacterium]
MLRTDARTIGRARTLRRKLTLPEGLLWRELRRRPEGLKFRRQHPCGRYVLDFYCDAAALAIEVDGMVHAMGNRPQRDECRDEWLSANGVKTLRIPVSDVLRELDSVVRQIVAACQPLHHSASPSGPPPLQGGV